MNKKLLKEINRLNQIMGTQPLMEQATLTKGLRALLGIADDAARVTLKWDDLINKFPKSAIATEGFVNRIRNLIPKSVKGIEKQKAWLAKTIGNVAQGKSITETQGKVLHQMAMEDKAIRKMYMEELVDLADKMGGKTLTEILENPSMTDGLQKFASLPQNLHAPDLRSLWSKMIPELKSIGLTKPKSILTKGGFGRWWSRFTGAAKTVEDARDIVLRKILLKQVGKNGTYWEIYDALFKLVDINSANKIVAKGGTYKNFNEFATSILNTLEKGQALGEQQLKTLQKVMLDNPKLRDQIYEGLSQSEVLKNFMRNNQKRWAKMKPDEIQKEKMDFFNRLIMADNDKFKLELFQDFAARSYNPYKIAKRAFLDPATIRRSVERFLDLFFNFGMYPNFQKYYWGAFGVTGIINFIAKQLPDFTGMFEGEKGSKAGLKPDFYEELIGAKSFVLKEGGLDDTQAMTVAKMLDGELNSLKSSINKEISKIYTRFREDLISFEKGKDVEKIQKRFPENYFTGNTAEKFGYESYKDLPLTFSEIKTKRQPLKLFYNYLASKEGEATLLDGAITYLTGVNDDRVQEIYTELIPTILASSQVTYMYDNKIKKKEGALSTDLEKLDPVFHVVPIPLLHFMVSDGKKDVLEILDKKRWIKSVGPGENSLAGVIENSWKEWPRFPDSLCSKKGCDPDTGGEELYSIYTGAIPADHLAILIDGDDETGAEPAEPKYQDGQDVQKWLNNLTIEEFNRAYLEGVAGKHSEPYGYTPEEVKTMERKVLTTKSNFVKGMQGLFADIDSAWEKMMENPDAAKTILGPKLYEIFQLTQEGYEEGLNN